MHFVQRYADRIPRVGEDLCSLPMADTLSGDARIEEETRRGIVIVVAFPPPHNSDCELAVRG